MDIEYTLGVFSDPHSNLAALDAVLEDMMSKYPVVMIACVGDIVGYYTQPSEVLKEVVEISDYIVRGNHDDAAAKNYIPNDFNMFAAQAMQYSIEKLSVNEKRTLYSLPTIESVNIDGKSIQFLHGSPEYPLDYYVFDGSKDQIVIAEYMELVNLDIIFMGHTHRPYIRLMNNGKVLANPGSVGQPRDGDNRPSYMVFDAKNMTGEIERVKYDYEITAKLVKEAGLHEHLGERLRKGK